MLGKIIFIILGLAIITIGLFQISGINDQLTIMNEKTEISVNKKDNNISV